MSDSSFLLVIGNKNLSSWSLRPWLALRQAGIPFDERVVLFEEEGWRDRIVTLSPSRRVPALRHHVAGAEDLIVWDSLAICEYAAELYPMAKLWPEERTARAIARAVSAEMHSGFANLRKDMPMDVVAREPRAVHSQETQADIDRLQAIWVECRARHGSGGPFLFGQFSIADAMFAPVVWRFRTYGVALRDRAREWYEAMLELPAMKEWERDAAAEVAAAPAKAQGRSTPDPTSAQHCFAVIFSSQIAGSSGDIDGYEATAAAMFELAKAQPGYLGFESARGADGFGISVSYWESLESIARWKANADHRAAQERGRTVFYSRYELRICSVERGYKHPA